MSDLVNFWLLDEYGAHLLHIRAIYLKLIFQNSPRCPLTRWSMMLFEMPDWSGELLLSHHAVYPPIRYSSEASFLFSFCLKRKEGSIFDLQAMHKTGFITVQNLCRTRRNLTSIKEKNIRACYKELFVSLIQHSNLHYNTLLTLSYRRI